MIGVGLSITQQRRKPWTPADLFRQVVGAVYDPSDRRTLFQDEHGTIPVTAPGDPVGLMLDKSGKGHHATQPITASRPTYQTDGTLHWLDSDGVDDSLHSLGFPALGSGPRTLMAAFELRGEAARPAVMTLGNADGDPMFMFAGMAEYAVRFHGGSIVFTGSAPVDTAQLAEWEAEGPEAGSAVVFRDGNQLEVSSASSPESIMATQGGLTLFEYPPTTGEMVPMRFYGGLVIASALRDAEKQRVRNYFARKAGVTL